MDYHRDIGDMSSCRGQISMCYRPACKPAVRPWTRDGTEIRLVGNWAKAASAQARGKSQCSQGTGLWKQGMQKVPRLITLRCHSFSFIISISELLRRWCWQVSLLVIISFICMIADNCSFGIVTSVFAIIGSILILSPCCFYGPHHYYPSQWHLLFLLMPIT